MVAEARQRDPGADRFRERPQGLQGGRIPLPWTRAVSTISAPTISPAEGIGVTTDAPIPSYQIMRRCCGVNGKVFASWIAPWVPRPQGSPHVGREPGDRLGVAEQIPVPVVVGRLGDRKAGPVGADAGNVGPADLEHQREPGDQVLERRGAVVEETREIIDQFATTAEFDGTSGTGVISSPGTELRVHPGPVRHQFVELRMGRTTVRRKSCGSVPCRCYACGNRFHTHITSGDSKVVIKHDIVVIGGGLAGMRAAVEAAERGADVAIVSKMHPVRSHSGAAQGGINAALGNREEDSPEAHAFDCVKGSDYLGDQDAIDAMAEDAPRQIIWLEHRGCIFSRMPDGRIAQRPFGGAGSPRTCYSADVTGLVILHTLWEQLERFGVKVYEEYFATALCVEDGVGSGVVAYNMRNGELELVTAKATIFATGGAGRMYAKTTNGYASTADGMAICYNAGIPLMDMEFIQFHPTSLKENGVLMTEAARGEGAYLLNTAGERFMFKYAPNKGELASRDVVSRAEWTEILEGRGVDGCVLLDLRHLGREKILERLPQIRELALDATGKDAIDTTDPDPARHALHDGRHRDRQVAARRAIPGVYAAGECACVSVHGANRLGGNSLLETIVFGARSAKHAANYIKKLGDVKPSRTRR